MYQVNVIKIPKEIGAMGESYQKMIAYLESFDKDKQLQILRYSDLTVIETNVDQKDLIISEMKEQCIELTKNYLSNFEKDFGFKTSAKYHVYHFHFQYGDAYFNDISPFNVAKKLAASLFDVPY